MPPRPRRARHDEGADPRTTRAYQDYHDYQDEYPEVLVEEDEAPPRRRGLNAATAGRVGVQYIADLTAKEPEGVTLVQPVESGWVVAVEVVEDHRIPSSSDILALYEVQLDEEGDLISYRRTRRYRRGAGDGGEVYGR
jgi:hypothetical protein